jgi:hypothetical protein
MKTTLLLMVWLAPGALWADAQDCPLQTGTLNGAYVLRSTGFAMGSPFAAVGVSTYDGQGNFTLTGTVSFNGTITRGLSGSGTYTVNSDCTGSQTFGTGPNASHFDFVISPNGREITYIQTDNGAVITAAAVRQDH